MNNYYYIILYNIIYHTMLSHCWRSQDGMSVLWKMFWKVILKLI